MNVSDVIWRKILGLFVYFFSDVVVRIVYFFYFCVKFLILEYGNVFVFGSMIFKE